MNRRLSVALVLLLALGLAAGCATRFSPDMIRDELESQSGRDPLTAFELNLGRFTTFLIESALDVTADGDLPFAGLDQLQVAVYDVPSDEGPALDVTRIHVRGWEQVVRFLDQQRSGMVLIKPSGEDIGDLVVVGAGKKTVLYARLRGKLSTELPKALAESLRKDGPDAVRDTLTELAAVE